MLDLPTGVPDPRASHLLVLARGPDGYRALSRAIAEAHLRTGTKGAADYRLEELAATGGRAVARAHRLPQGAVRRALAGGDPSGVAGREPRPGSRPRGPSSTGSSRCSAGTTWPSRSPTAGDPYDSERADALAAPRGRRRAAARRHRQRALRHPARRRPGRRARRGPRAVVAGGPGRLAARRPDGAPAVGRRDARAAPPAPVGRGDRGGPGRRVRVRPVPRRARTCRPTRCRPATPRPRGCASWSGAARCELYGPPEAERVPGAYAQLAHELDVIEDLGFPGYFLVVYDLVDFCRRNGILAQGRGSAANSAVCYALRVTAVDAVRHGLLFERFLAPERDGPPDIDVDIESGAPRGGHPVRLREARPDARRAGGQRHLLPAAVGGPRRRPGARVRRRAAGRVGDSRSSGGGACGRPHRRRRPRSRRPAGVGSRASARRPHRAGARRPPVTTARDERRRTQASMWGNTWEPPSVLRAPKGVDTPGLVTADGHDVVPAVLPPSASDLDEIPEHVIDLADRFLRLPRHLGIHSGGMVMCDRPVIEVCPVEWARMPGRTVLQWDKEDCADAGLVKFDLLGLGMLTALRIGFDARRASTRARSSTCTGCPRRTRRSTTCSAPRTPSGCSRWSRARRWAPCRACSRGRSTTSSSRSRSSAPAPSRAARCTRTSSARTAAQPVTYLHPLLEKSLAKTKGVPLFQEQLMQMAIDVADFTPAEADQLRRAMGSKRSTERMEAMRGRLMSGMAGHGIDEETGAADLRQAQGVRRLRLPRVARVLVRVPRLRQRVAEGVPPGRVLRGAARGAADGLLLAADAWPPTPAGTAWRCCARTCRRPTCRRAWSAWVRRRRAVSRSWCRRRAGPGRSPPPGVRTGDGARSLAVRLGLASVRSVGEDVAQRVVDERRAHGPFADLRAAGAAGAAVAPRSSRRSPPPGRSTAWASRVGRRCGRPARSRRRGRTRCPGSPSG